MAIIKTKFDRGVEGATNIVDGGTEGTRVATGTTAQRGSTTGQWRFNTTTGYFEGRNNSGSFATLEPVPTVASVDVTEVDSQAGGNQTFVITGTNFSSGGVISFVGSSANFNATSTTIDSTTQITAVAPKASFLNAQEPYKIKFTSSTGLTGTSADLITVDTSPAWQTASGSLGSAVEGSSVNVSATATDADSDTIAYSETGGNVLSTNNLTLNSSSGAITGTAPTVSNDTTLSFNLRATANSKTADRAFTIIIQNNPLTGLTELSEMNSENTSNFKGTLSNGGNLYEVTDSSVIDTVAGTTWEGTRLTALNDGGNCGRWDNKLNNMASSGGVTIVHWGRLSSGAGNNPPTVGSYNNSYARNFDTYNHTGYFNDMHNPTSTTTGKFSTPFFGGNNLLSINTLTGANSITFADWHFYAHRFSQSPKSTSSQTEKISFDYNGTLYHATSGSHSLSSNSSTSGFMGFDNVNSGGVGSYNWEGWTGGWRVFNNELTDAQLNFIYNSGKGRF